MRSVVSNSCVDTSVTRVVESVTCDSCVVTSTADVDACVENSAVIVVSVKVTVESVSNMQVSWSPNSHLFGEKYIKSVIIEGRTQVKQIAKAYVLVARSKM